MHRTSTLAARSLRALALALCATGFARAQDPVWSVDFDGALSAPAPAFEIEPPAAASPTIFDPPTYQNEYARLEFDGAPQPGEFAFLATSMDVPLGLPPAQPYLIELRLRLSLNAPGAAVPLDLGWLHADAAGDLVFAGWPSQRVPVQLEHGAWTTLRLDTGTPGVSGLWQGGLAAQSVRLFFLDLAPAGAALAGGGTLDVDFVRIEPRRLAHFSVYGGASLREWSGAASKWSMDQVHDPDNECEQVGAQAHEDPRWSGERYLAADRVEGAHHQMPYPGLHAAEEPAWAETMILHSRAVGVEGFRFECSADFTQIVDAPNPALPDCHYIAYDPAQTTLTPEQSALGHSYEVLWTLRRARDRWGYEFGLGVSPAFDRWHAQYEKAVDDGEVSAPAHRGELIAEFAKTVASLFDVCYGPATELDPAAGVLGPGGRWNGRPIVYAHQTAASVFEIGGSPAGSLDQVVAPEDVWFDRLTGLDIQGLEQALAACGWSGVHEPLWIANDFHKKPALANFVDGGFPFWGLKQGEISPLPGDPECLWSQSLVLADMTIDDLSAESDEHLAQFYALDTSAWTEEPVFVSGVFRGKDDHKAQAWGSGRKRGVEHGWTTLLHDTWADHLEYGRSDFALLRNLHDWTEGVSLFPSREYGHAYLAAAAEDIWTWRGDDVDHARLLRGCAQQYELRTELLKLRRIGFDSGELSALESALQRAGLAIWRRDVERAEAEQSTAWGELDVLGGSIQAKPVFVEWVAGACGLPHTESGLSLRDTGTTCVSVGGQDGVQLLPTTAAKWELGFELTDASLVDQLADSYIERLKRFADDPDGYTGVAPSAYFDARVSFEYLDTDPVSGAISGTDTLELRSDRIDTDWTYRRVATLPLYGVQSWRRVEVDLVGPSWRAGQAHLEFFQNDPQGGPSAIRSLRIEGTLYTRTQP